MNILIVDDHPTNLKLLRVILESDGHSVVEARDGHEGLHCVEGGAVDLVISDVLLPNSFDGYSLCSQIRERENFDHIGFIVYTASYTSDADEHFAIDAGADAFIRKPSTPEQILEVVHKTAQSDRRNQPLNVDTKLSDRKSQATVNRNEPAIPDSPSQEDVGSKLHQLFEHSSVVLYSYNLANEGNPSIAVSKNFSRVFRLGMDRISLSEWVSHVHQDDQEAFNHVFSEMVNSEGYSIVYRLVLPDQSIRWVEDNCRLASKQDGDGREIIGSWVDMTDRVFAAKALADSQYQFRALLEASDFTAVIVDLEGKVTFCNDSILRLTGWKREQIIGNPWFSLVTPPEHVPLDAWLLSTSLAPGQTTYESNVITESGETRSIVWSRTPIRSQGGNLIAVAIIGEDITERKRATLVLEEMNRELERRVQERTAALESLNTELKVAKEAAEMANEAKSVFLSRMSHEFRTPMNSILGFGQLLGMSDLNEDDQDSVQHILRSGEHLLSLINEVLEISKVEQGNFGIVIEDVDLQSTLNSAISMFSIYAKEKGVSVQCETTDLVLRADEQRLRQILINLISNGIKYNVPGGEVLITVWPGLDGWASIDVEDNGIGISPEDMTKLFVPFERLGAEQRNIDGTGLGLTLSKSLAEAMGGSLTFHSSEGRGSIFRVTMRISSSAESSHGSQVRLLSKPVSRGGDHTILVIEDNPANSQLLQRIFSHRNDVKVVMAPDGTRGLELVKSVQPSLVLLDYHLPDMNGGEVLEQIKKSEGLESIPVIIVSADAHLARKSSLLEMGAVSYITKPFEIETLLEAVDRAIGQGEGNG